MWMRKRKSPGRNGLTAFIDEGSEIEGKYTFSGTVMLNGRFKGEISTTDTLIIGEKAAVNGDVRAGRVLVSGLALWAAALDVIEPPGERRAGGQYLGHRARGAEAHGAGVR